MWSLPIFRVTGAPSTTKPKVIRNLLKIGAMQLDANQFGATEVIMTHDTFAVLVVLAAQGLTMRWWRAPTISDLIPRSAYPIVRRWETQDAVRSSKSMRGRDCIKLFLIYFRVFQQTSA